MVILIVSTIITIATITMAVLQAIAIISRTVTTVVITMTRQIAHAGYPPGLVGRPIHRVP
jgi:hypothetical protein